MNEISKILNIANNEVGYLEKSKTAYVNNPAVIYSKTDGAGKDNITKYAKEMDDLNVYNSKKQGYSWCKIFIDWCFVQAVGKDEAKKLLNDWTAGVTQCYNWFKSANQIYSNPTIGDLIIFGDCDHIGIVENVANGKVYTIEGNSSSQAGVVSNGGAVVKKSYAIGSSYIKCYARPQYVEILPDLRYKAHIENIGWTDWVDGSNTIGTVGQGLRIEAIVLEGHNGLDLQYRVHIQNIGWTDWSNNGEVCGTEGQALRIEAIEVKANKQLEAQEHIQDIGWVPISKGTNIYMGTQTKSLRIEAFAISVK